MEELEVADLLDDINTDAMTPAWVCFNHRPEDIARDAYAGLIVDGKRLFERDALRDGNFEVIVSGYRKGVGSSRETAVQAEKWSGIRIAIAASFAPIHAANNIAQGVLMGDHEMLSRLQAGEAVSARRVLRRVTTRSRSWSSARAACFPSPRRSPQARSACRFPPRAPRPMTMAEKILAAAPARQRPGRALREARRRSGRRRSTAATRTSSRPRRSTTSSSRSTERTTRITNPQKFAVFEDHLIYADEVASDAAVHRQDRDAARAAARVSAPHRLPRFLGEGRASRPASATRSRASTSSIPATSSRPPTATPAWAA